jgi:putative endopeptidase
MKQAVFASIAVCLLSVAATQNSTGPDNHGIVLAKMDGSVRPGDDFYHYANGAWIKRTELPPDRSFIDAYGLDNDYMGSGTLARP